MEDRLAVMLLLVALQMEVVEHQVQVELLVQAALQVHLELLVQVAQMEYFQV